MKKKKQILFVAVVFLVVLMFLGCNKQETNILVGVWEDKLNDYVLEVLSDDTAVLKDYASFIYKYDEREDGFITIYFYDFEGYEMKAWYDGSAIVFEKFEFVFSKR